jgi:hypothetical protein
MTRRGSQMSSLVHQEGWAKREAEVARGADGDVNNNTGVARSAGGDAGGGADAMRGTGGGSRAVRAEVPATEEW